MTTKHSPLRVLKAQADKIAATIKAAERGEPVAPAFAAQMGAARGKESFKVGVVMDDKTIIIQIPWVTIRDTSEVALAEWILRQMREIRETAQ